MAKIVTKKKPAAPLNLTAQIEHAILETIAVKERVAAVRIVFSVQHRLGRQKVTASEAAVKRGLAALEARGAIARASARGRTSFILGDNAETRAVTKAKKKKAAACTANAKPPLDKARCYVLAKLPDVFAVLAGAIARHFKVVEQKPEAVAFQWRQPAGKGPTLRIFPCERAEVRRQMGGGRYSFRCVREYESFAVLVFNEDLAEILDEINTLIEAQRVLLEASNGLLYNAWNHAFIEPPESKVPKSRSRARGARGRST